MGVKNFKIVLGVSWSPKCIPWDFKKKKKNSISPPELPQEGRKGAPRP